MLARRFRNLDESFEATTSTIGMKEKKNIWRNCSFLKNVTFKDHGCLKKTRSRTKTERKQREKLELLIKHEGGEKKRLRIRQRQRAAHTGVKMGYSLLITRLDVVAT